MVWGAQGGFLWSQAAEEEWAEGGREKDVYRASLQPRPQSTEAIVRPRSALPAAPARTVGGRTGSQGPRAVEVC